MTTRFAPRLLAAGLVCTMLPAAASPIIARAPTLVRQTYFDGSYVELGVEIAAAESNIRVSICAQMLAVAASFSLPRERLSFAFGVPEFLYWAGPTESDAKVAFSSSCTSSELAKAGIAEDQESECRLGLEFAKGELRAAYVEVYAPGKPSPIRLSTEMPHMSLSVAQCDQTMHSSGLRGQSTVFPDVLSARGRSIR